MTSVFGGASPAAIARASTRVRRHAAPAPAGRDRGPARQGKGIIPPALEFLTPLTPLTPFPDPAVARRRDQITVS
jgi:hypothetical protein